MYKNKTSFMIVSSTIKQSLFKKSVEWLFLHVINLSHALIEYFKTSITKFQNPDYDSDGNENRWYVVGSAN